MGYYPVKQEDMPYDREYFERYQRQADTDIGRALTKARIALVDRHYDSSYELLDVGIGSGAFLDECLTGCGFDVNPAAIEWLANQGLFGDLYTEKWRALTFWDSLEHIQRPDLALAQAGEFVFVSIPTFMGAEHCLASKHFRKDEHIWYWTADGFADWMAKQGFEELERNVMETELGREGITSYAFKRVSSAD